MPLGLGVLPLQSVALLGHHGLVIGPLPVVDYEPAGAAGEPLLTESQLTTTRVSANRERFEASPDFQPCPPIIHDEIVFPAQGGREGEVGLELSLAPILTPLPGKVIGHCVDAHLSRGHIIDKIQQQQTLFCF